MLQLDIDAVHQNCDDNFDKISNIEQTIDRMEKRAIKANENF